MARLSGYKWASLRWAIRADFQIDLLISYININIITSHEKRIKAVISEPDIRLSISCPLPHPL